MDSLPLSLCVQLILQAMVPNQLTTEPPPRVYHLLLPVETGQLVRVGWHIVRRRSKDASATNTPLLHIPVRRQ